VEKYTEYLHGDPKNERRVVLDRDCLPRVAQAENLRVVPRADLLERFLSTLEEQSRLATDFDEHLPRSSKAYKPFLADLIWCFGYARKGLIFIQ